jgi:hypothetical protein
LDPYGEDDWNEPLNVDFEIGDKVVCVDNQNTQLKQDKGYTCEMGSS